MSTPMSTIYLCAGVRLDSRYEHSIYFADKAAQEEYFAGKVVKTFPAYSYLRKSWSIKIEGTLEQAKGCNYLYFRNTPSGKTYFYFISRIEYVNDNTVELFLEMDVIQTFMFDWELLPCFVERQHTETDKLGEHTVDEGLEMGAPYCTGRLNLLQPQTGDQNNMCIMIMSTVNPASTNETAVKTRPLPYLYNNVFSGVKLWAVDAADWVAWGQQMDTLDSLGGSEGILAMWMYPKSLVVLGGEDTWDSDVLVHTVEHARGMNDGIVYELTEDVDSRYLGTGFRPKNYKLYGYPYCYMYATNNMGSSAVYRWEFWPAPEDGGPAFVVTGSLTPDGGARLIPMNYNGQVRHYREGITLNGYPTCAWDTDMYKLWLAQNQNTQSLGMGSAVLKIGAGIAGAVAGAAGIMTGVGAVAGVPTAAAGVGMVASGAQQIAGMVAQKRDQELEPPQAKGTYSASVNMVNNEHCFSLYFMCPNPEHARIIDDYFTMYGYKLNRVQVPNICARPSFTYVKTVDCHINGYLGTEDRVKIESIFDKGITFWTDGDRVADYSQDNEVTH